VLCLREIPEVRAAQSAYSAFNIALASVIPLSASMGTRADYSAPPVSSPLASSIPAIKAIRTRSDKLAACIFIMRLAR
jgi:hypothetical protein